ncbi:MAG: PAS domain S-box protein, partial [Candidatus Eremiobacterota bacterium]
DIILNNYSHKDILDDKIEHDGIHFFKTLYGWNREPVIVMDIVSKTSIINSLNNASNWSFLIVITYALILLILLYTSITLWIRSPLRSITMALNKDDPDYLERLKQDRSEFGHISTLINQFFAQRSELIKEIEERKYLNEKLGKEINERKQIEALLRESEKRYRHLLEIAQEGIWAIDGDGNTTFINPKISDILGYNAEEMLGKKFLDFIKEDDREYFRTNMEKYKKTIKEGLDCEFIKKEGKKIYTSVSMSPINDDKGNYTGTLALVTDITEKRLAEEEKSKLEHQLRHSDKIRAIGTMASGIAHDFNNILVAILGYTEAMIYNTTEGSIFEKNLKEIRNACNRAINLVKQILTFSRKSEVKRIPLQISPIVKETLKLLRRLLPSTVELKEHIEENLVWIKADPTQIQQIIINLCTNAAQAMSKSSGSMEVILKNLSIQAKDITIYENMKPGTYLQLIVTDTGHGIPPEIKERIFEPYFTTKKTGEGSGMGLAVVYGIVKSYGGEITVDSNIGKGTTITICFPGVEIDDKLPEKEDLHILPGGKGKILFVDDEEMSIVKIMKELLEQMGYQISSRNSSIEALQIFREKPDEYAIVITDEIMPKMKGSELAEEILHIRPDIPVILITGYSDPDLIEKATAIGVKEVLIKPVTLGKLTKTIRELLSDDKRISER